MSTAIQLFAPAGVAQVDEIDLMMMEEAAKAGEKHAYDLVMPRIKMASGGLAVFSNEAGDVITPPLRVVILVAQNVRAWWPKKGEASNKPPVCQSRDTVKGFFDGTSESIVDAVDFHVQHPALKFISDPELAAGPWECKSCPLAQWGSVGVKETDRGQACTSKNRMLVLIEGWSQPAILSIPTMSLKNWSGYASARSRKPGQFYFTAWTKITLTQDKNSTGTTYSVAQFAYDGELSREQKLAVIEFRRMYEEKVRASDVVGDDYDVPGDVPGEVVDGDMPPF